MIRVVLLFGAWLAFAGCQSEPKTPEVQPLVARFFLEARSAEPAVTLQLPVSRVAINVSPKPVVVEYDIAGVDVVRVDLGWCLMFRFTPAATRDFYRLSASSQGRRLLLTLNGQPAGARRIDQAISEGGLLMFVEVPDTDLPELASRIRQTSEMLAAREKR